MKMVAKQLSIFLENRQGRLMEVTRVLAEENINFSALCIAENNEFGILRGIVSDPQKACDVLKKKNFAASLTDVLGISCPNKPGMLSLILKKLADSGIFIEYMYSFALNHATITVIRPNDLKKCIAFTENHPEWLLRNCKPAIFPGSSS